MKIDKSIKEKIDGFSVATLEFSVKVEKNKYLDQLIDKTENEISNKYTIKDVIKIPNILKARNAYKAFGKDPSRYRLAVESLYRRLSKGNKLYRINNLVDLGNILSIKSVKSIAVLDKDKISGDILVRLGTSSDDYEGIGRGRINIEKIPLYEEDIGPFESTKSDNERTMNTKSTKNVLILIISFNGDTEFEQDIETAKKLYKDYCNIKDFKVEVFK